METVQEVAAEVLTVIPNHRRWLKGYEYSFNGTRRCVVGAVGILWRRVQVSPELVNKFCCAMLSVAKVEYPDCDTGSLVNFNDDPRIKYEDVRRVMEKVRAL